MKSESDSMNILVTGGTSGIGRKVVENLSSQGHDVGFVGRNKEKGDEISKLTGTTFFKADISKATECEKVTQEYFEAFKHCDVLINNAGLWTEGPLIETPTKEIEDVITINSISPIILTQKFLQKMIPSIESGTQKGARLVFVNSLAGLNVKADRSVYFASKWALTGFVRSLSMELSPHNIAVTNVCPGQVKTELFDNAGYPREIDGFLDPKAVADAISYVVSVPDGVQIGEITVKPTAYI